MKGRIDARNSLETYCYNMKTTIEDKLGDQLEDDDKDKVGPCKHSCALLWCNIQCCAATIWFQYMDRVGVSLHSTDSKGSAQHRFEGVCAILVQHASSALQLPGAQYRVLFWLVCCTARCPCTPLCLPQHVLRLPCACLFSCCVLQASCLPASLSTCPTAWERLAHPACHTAVGQDSCR